MQNTKSEQLKQLEAQREKYALEAFNPNAIPGAFKALVSDISQAFKASSIFTQSSKITPIPKDQSKFLQILESIPYTEICELRAYTPEGMICTYLEFLSVLKSVTVYIKGVQSNVVRPYSLFLAQFVSDAKSSLSTNNQKIELQDLESKRENIYSAFSKLYAPNSYKSDTRVKNVIERNSDWKEVFIQLQSCIDDLESIDQNLLLREVKQCSDYLELIYKQFDSSEDRIVSAEIANRLSNQAYNVASELELMATTHYRALALKGSIENTIEHITKCLG